ncbi:MAG TPA: hypothetical protein VFE19_00150 [Jatrophihabitantaceae bacterium]|nr:hypothetical protein [Jatrophihabitantaceae bacterium]
MIGAVLSESVIASVGIAGRRYPGLSDQAVNAVAHRFGLDWK